MALSDVYLPVMRKIIEAPPTSPLANIDTNNLSDFILQLTQPLPGSAVCEILVKNFFFP